MTESSKPFVLILQHATWERPGRIQEALEEAGLDTKIMTILDTKKPDVPNPEEYCGVVIMGGPMGALDFEDYPGLKAEHKIVKTAVESNKPVLGICLGHQIIATALGGKLKKGKESEIGFGHIDRVNRHEFAPLESDGMNVLHWHNDVVSVPEGSTIIAKSDITKVQAFAYGSALGLQYHLEVSPAILDQWLSEPTMVEGLKKSQIKKIRDEFEENDTLIHRVADTTFSAFAARCASYARELA
ncbi:type 1 glutamine amidotransferase [Alloscardovia theropitheci]|uniref:Type 1 glutamine amidotransferase n=1 Tax=Alloscardovia theropitheci TaxID=2496842 RepID=A0A4V2MU22_9BIFI|nr:type 1 glutamine amidotransferase [Alloscardovia theropitheci]TCD54689.1 type 1 glutamine amidotransferase [Alloscardovia theropitheci]